MSETLYQVTRFCCTSGMCVECRLHKQRRRIIHAQNLSKEMADRMVVNWKAYGAKATEMGAEEKEESR